jgi:predicted RNA-binding Zn-ribbon protein involved in translation (DUF1610 family)
MRYACPKCGSTDLEVTIEAWAKLVQTPDGNVETDTDTVWDTSHTWTENSVMRCTKCGHYAIADEFDSGDPNT